MAKTRAEKEAMLEGYSKNLEGSTAVILVSQSGLTPKETSTLKVRLSTVGSKYNVVKNRIFMRALESLKMPTIGSLDFGNNSAVYVSEDVATTAKILKEFNKEYGNKLEFRAGLIDGQVLSAEQTQELADMPSIEQSIAMIAGLLEQSMTGVVNVLEDSMRSVVIILDQAFKE